jgi:putative ABC transport system permease protein
MLLATLRRQPAPLLGTLGALTVAALLVTILTALVGTAITMTVPAGRLAGASVVVTGNPDVRFTYGHGQDASTDVVPLPVYRRLPAGLAARLAALPGVARAIPQVSVPVTLELPGGRLVTGGQVGLTGYNWPSAALTPFTLTSGHAPLGPDQIVVGAGLARSARLRLGDQVRLAGAGQPPYTVVGVAGSGRNPAQNSALFWSATQASIQYGHPGSADLIGLVARPGTSAPALAAQVRTALAGRQLYRQPVAPGSRRGCASVNQAGRQVGCREQRGRAPHDCKQHRCLRGVVPAAPGRQRCCRRRALGRFAGQAPAMTVSAGTARGQAADLTVAADKDNLIALADGVGSDVVLIAMFVVAGAVSLSVLQRRRQFALLRAIGATSGRIRRLMLAELAVLGTLAALIAYLPGIWLAGRALRGLAGQQFVPAATRLWASPLVLLIAAGTGVVVAELAGFVAARRASRVRPAEALTEASVERRWPHPVRVALGVIALGGAVALGILTIRLHQGADQRLNLASFTLLASMAAVAFLGPILVAAAELILRLPFSIKNLAERRADASPHAAWGLWSGAPGRLALADLRVRPRRMAASVVSVALAVSFTGTVYLIDAIEIHAAQVQGRQRLVANEVVTAPGGLAPGALAAVAARPGVAAAVGLTPTTVLVPASGEETAQAEAVTTGPLSDVLDLRLVAGSLAHFRPGDIALSNFAVGSGAVNTRVGQHLITYLADGTRYRATVVAIFSQSLGFADVLVPAGAAGGGHLGTGTLGQILVHARPGVAEATVAARIAPLARQFPGLQVAGRSLVNAQYDELAAQSSYLNNLILSLIVALAAVTLANTLITVAVERRESLRLLRRVGATSRQLMAMAGWQVLALNLTAIMLGAGAAALAVSVASRVLTGSYVPYLTPAPLTALVAGVLVLSALSSIGPTALILSASETD